MRKRKASQTSVGIEDDFWTQEGMGQDGKEGVGCRYRSGAMYSSNFAIDSITSMFLLIFHIM